MFNRSIGLKKALVIGLMTSVSLANAGAAFAQDRDYRHDDSRRESNDSDRGDYDRNHNDEHGQRAWDRGQKVPREYLQESNIYRGWRDSGLRSPPRDSQWILLDGQYILADRRSGLIAEVRIVPARVERDNGNRDQLWRQRYQHAYSYNDDVAYTECHTSADPAGVLAGAVLGGILGNAAGGRHDRGGATAAGVVAGGALGAALTSKMDCGDRSYAYQSYSLAFNGGRANAVYQWNNPQNRHRGEMRVLDYYNDEDNFHCAVFTHTVYVGDRPEEARGRACQQPNGTWAIID